MSEDSDQGPPPGRPAGSKQRKWVITAVAALAAVAASVAGYAVFGRGESEQAKIKKVVAQFAIAVDEVNMPKVIALLCPEEASGITDNPDAPTGADRVTDAKPRPVTISDVRIKGDIASALVTRHGQKPARLWLKKEAGSWKVCAPAGGAG